VAIQIGQGVGDGVAVGVGVWVNVGVGVWVAVGVAVWVNVGVGVWVAVGVGVWVAVGVAVWVAVGVGVWVAVGVGVWVAVGVAVGGSGVSVGRRGGTGVSLITLNTAVALSPTTCTGLLWMLWVSQGHLPEASPMIRTCSHAGPTTVVLVPTAIRPTSRPSRRKTAVRQESLAAPSPVMVTTVSPSDGGTVAVGDDVAVGVSVGAAVGDDVAVGVSVGAAVGEDVAVGVSVGVAVGDGVAVGVSVDVAVGDGVCVCVGLGVKVGRGVFVGWTMGAAPTGCLGETVGVGVGG